jgi:hypothetical protein
MKNIIYIKLTLLRDKNIPKWLRNIIDRVRYVCIF